MIIEMDNNHIINLIKTDEGINIEVNPNVSGEGSCEVLDECILSIKQGCLFLRRVSDE